MQPACLHSPDTRAPPAPASCCCATRHPSHASNRSCPGAAIATAACWLLLLGRLLQSGAVAGVLHQTAWLLWRLLRLRSGCPQPSGRSLGGAEPEAAGQQQGRGTTATETLSLESVLWQHCDTVLENGTTMQVESNRCVAPSSIQDGVLLYACSASSSSRACSVWACKSTSSSPKHKCLHSAAHLLPPACRPSPTTALYCCCNCRLHQVLLQCHQVGWHQATAAAADRPCHLCCQVVAMRHQQHWLAGPACRHQEDWCRQARRHLLQCQRR